MSEPPIADKKEDKPQPKPSCGYVFIKAITNPLFLLKGLIVFTIAILKFVAHSQ